jgi:DNA-directed RNA polymerase specialized sigma24 family protein
LLAERWEQALGDLAAERGTALKRQAFLLCGDDAQADDLVQEALVRAFTRPLRILRPGGTEAYVRTIMVSLFIDGTRRQSRWRRVAPLGRPAGAAPDPAGAGGRPRRGTQRPAVPVTAAARLRGPAVLRGPAHRGDRAGTRR